MLQIKTRLLTGSLGLLVALTVQAGGLLPDIPKAKRKYSEKTQCVEPVEEMRRNHMNYIKHQRDDTMRSGIRSTKHSLKECIGCHNAPADDNKVASVETKQHFCNACHSYAAVKIDCFDCHNDKPPNAEYRHETSNNHVQVQHTNEQVAASEERRP